MPSINNHNPYDGKPHIQMDFPLELAKWMLEALDYLMEHSTPGSAMTAGIAKDYFRNALESTP